MHRPVCSDTHHSLYAYSAVCGCVASCSGRSPACELHWCCVARCQGQAQRACRYPWNIITSSFITSSFLDLAVAIAVLLGAAQAAEPVYGPTEFLKLITVAAIACGCTSFILQYAWFFFHLSAVALFSEHGGFYGVQGALFVAIKHVMPGQDVTIFPGIAVPTRYLPGIYMVVLTLLSLISGDLTALRFAVVGTFSGWLYLRFFKPSGPDGALPRQELIYALKAALLQSRTRDQHSLRHAARSLQLGFTTTVPRTPARSVQGHKCRFKHPHTTASYIPSEGRGPTVHTFLYHLAQQPHASEMLAVLRS